MNYITFLRQYRVVDFAIFDLTLAYVGMFILSPFLSFLFKKLGVHIPKRNWIFLTLPIGITVHILTHQNTLMTKNFFSLQDHYVLKAIIIGMLILGLHGIRKTKKN